MANKVQIQDLSRIFRFSGATSAEAKFNGYRGDEVCNPPLALLVLDAIGSAR